MTQYFNFKIPHRRPTLLFFYFRCRTAG